MTKSFDRKNLVRTNEDVCFSSKLEFNPGQLEYIIASSIDKQNGITCTIFAIKNIHPTNYSEILVKRFLEQNFFHFATIFFNYTFLLFPSFSFIRRFVSWVPPIGFFGERQINFKWLMLTLSLDVSFFVCFIRLDLSSRAKNAKNAKYFMFT